MLPNNLFADEANRLEVTKKKSMALYKQFMLKYNENKPVLSNYDLTLIRRNNKN